MIQPTFLNADDETMLARLIRLKAAGVVNGLVEATATGNPVSFSTEVAKPLKSLIIPFSPVQSGSGDPAPDNVRPISGWTGLNIYRTGVNLCGCEWENGQILSDGTESGTDYRKRTVGYFPVIGGKDYRIISNDEYKRVYWYDKGKTFISSDTGSSAVKTAPDNAFFARAVIINESTTPDEFSFNYPSSDTEYHAYTGESIPVVFPAMGKNLQNPANVVNGYFGLIDGNNAFIASNNGRVVYMPCKPNTTYAISKMQGGQRFGVYCSAEIPKNGTIVQPVTQVSYVGTYQKVITTPADAQFLCSFVWLSTADTEITAADMIASVQVEENDAVTAFEPFTNTVYGGELDALTGVLTVTQYGIYASALDWANSSQASSGIFMTFVPFGRSNKDYNIICNQYKTLDASSTMASMEDNSIKGNSNTPTRIYIRDSRYTDAAQWLAANGSMLFVYELATPQTVQLDPVTVQTLIGTNVLWTDTNGTNEVTYLKKKG